MRPLPSVPDHRDPLPDFPARNALSDEAKSSECAPT